MKLISCGITDIGRKRQRNEDSYLVSDQMQLYIIADGMGGHAGGEFASKIAVSTVEEFFKGENSQGDESEKDDIEEQDLLRSAITRAGNKIVQKANEEPELRGMGTTATVMVFFHDKAFIAHVGDSRAYCVRGGAITQITEDHSLVHEQLKSGLITEEEARTHQLKNIITRSVGVQEDVEIDTVVWKVEKGDTYLLCSDGLSNMVSDGELEQEIVRSDIENAAKSLVDLANQHGGEDNITLILVHVADV